MGFRGKVSDRTASTAALDRIADALEGDLGGLSLTFTDNADGTGALVIQAVDNSGENMSIEFNCEVSLLTAAFVASASTAATGAAGSNVSTNTQPAVLFSSNASGKIDVIMAGGAANGYVRCVPHGAPLRSDVIAWAITA